MTDQMNKLPIYTVRFNIAEAIEWEIHVPNKSLAHEAMDRAIDELYYNGLQAIHSVIAECDFDVEVDRGSLLVTVHTPWR